MKILTIFTVLLTAIHLFLFINIRGQDTSGLMIAMLTLPLNFILILTTVIFGSIKLFNKKIQRYKVANSEIISNWQDAPVLGLLISFYPLLNFLVFNFLQMGLFEMFFSQSESFFISLATLTILFIPLNLFFWLTLNPKYRLFILIPVIFFEPQLPAFFGCWYIAYSWGACSSQALLTNIFNPYVLKYSIIYNLTPLLILVAGFFFAHKIKKGS